MGPSSIVTLDPSFEVKQPFEVVEVSREFVEVSRFTMAVNPYLDLICPIFIFRSRLNFTQIRQP